MTLGVFGAAACGGADEPQDTTPAANVGDSTNTDDGAAVPGDEKAGGKVETGDTGDDSQPTEPEPQPQDPSQPADPSQPHPMPQPTPQPSPVPTPAPTP
ncbi:MAG TPA: hypothetical protein VIG06_11365 [Kofleriaceae bacterium]|jgi:hypothetical protein